MSANDYPMALHLPLFTSPETVIVMEWLTQDAQRHEYWSQKAHDLVRKQSMEAATHYLANLLCEQVTRDLDSPTGVSHALIEATIRRVNFYELAVGLLRPYDTTRYFEPLPEMDGEDDQLIRSAA